MTDYTIYINDIEALQDTNDTMELDKIFNKAKSTIVQGQQVILSRKNKNAEAQIFDTLTTESELKAFKETVLKYVRE